MNILTTFSQKEIVKVLDGAARRSDYPASAKQTWYLAGLMFRAGQERAEREISDFILGSLPLSGRDASAFINQFKN